MYESSRNKKQCQGIHPDLHRIVGDLRHRHYQKPEQPCNMQSEVLPDRCQCINEDSHKRKHRCKLAQYDGGSRRNQYLSNIMKELQIPVIKWRMHILPGKGSNFLITMLYKIHGKYFIKPDILSECLKQAYKKGKNSQNQKENSTTILPFFFRCSKNKPLYYPHNCYPTLISCVLFLLRSTLICHLFILT